ncbi:hypothetical protein LPJ61_005460 [Coemansia biformis]|uniref:Thioesterase domain-containing protein n=1 Tax=Coemansia biformis TaxID=1286918 RepID=A0A9W8CUE9_9FUNG|nr:hypothetical protein LPJ61_005460 [Coemansia biformis]
MDATVVAAAAVGPAAADEEFRQLVVAEAQRKASTYYYTAGLECKVVSASCSERSMTVELTVDAGMISSAQVLDEGLVGTIADYWTSTLITATSGGKHALTTSLSVQALRPVAEGATVHVVCTATESSAGSAPHATARFVLASDPTLVVALAAHTKFFKALPQKQPAP